MLIEFDMRRLSMEADFANCAYWGFLNAAVLPEFDKVYARII